MSLKKSKMVLLQPQRRENCYLRQAVKVEHAYDRGTWQRAVDCG